MQYNEIAYFLKLMFYDLDITFHIVIGLIICEYYSLTIPIIIL